MIIGITGKKGSGKSTAAEFLVPLGYKHHGFADLLKDATCTLFGITREYLENVKNNGLIELYNPSDEGEVTVTVRKFLQRMGTEVGREMFGEDFWVDQFYRRHSQFHRIVISDVRFNNEARAILNRGGRIVEIQRPGLDDSDAHASEQGIDKNYIDMFIMNAGSLATLRERIIDFAIGED